MKMKKYWTFILFTAIFFLVFIIGQRLNAEKVSFNIYTTQPTQVVVDIEISNVDTDTVVTKEHFGLTTPAGTGSYIVDANRALYVVIHLATPDSSNYITAIMYVWDGTKYGWNMILTMAPGTQAASLGYRFLPYEQSSIPDEGSLTPIGLSK